MSFNRVFRNFRLVSYRRSARANLLCFACVQPVPCRYESSSLFGFFRKLFSPPSEPPEFSALWFLVKVEPFSYRIGMPGRAISVRIFPFFSLMILGFSSRQIINSNFALLRTDCAARHPTHGRSGHFGHPFRNCFRFTPISILGCIFSSYPEPVLFVLSVPSRAKPHDYHNDP